MKKREAADKSPFRSEPPGVRRSDRAASKRVKYPVSPTALFRHDESVSAYRRRANPTTLFSLLALRCATLLVASVWLSTGSAQGFSGPFYYQQCRRLEALGDLEAARQSCLNALELNAATVDTKLALARVELGMGNAASAEARLNELRDLTQSAEPYVLLAEAALAGGRYDAAESYLRTARERLAQIPDSEFEGRFYFVGGKIAAFKGDYGAAQRAYRSATLSEPLNRRYPVALAGLLFDLGDAAGARAELERYEQFSGATRDPLLLSLMGRVKWAQSDLSGATRDLETAVALRGSEDASAQAEDLRALALIYYGQGDTRAGSLALRAALRRGALLLTVLNRSLLWLALLVGLLALHLLGESRVVRTSAVDELDVPKVWTVRQVYTVLAVALGLSLAVTFVYSVVRYDNYLAVLTPLQGGDVRSLYFACVGVFLFLFTLLRLSRDGFDPVETLLGGADKAALGAVVGVGLLALTVAYFVYVPGFGSFYLNFSRLTPTLVAAVVLVPLSEVFFRGFAMPPFQARYPRVYATLLSGVLFALVFVSPVLLLLAIGLILAEVFRRTGSGLATLVASLVLHLGLVVGVALLPWVRQLFA